MWNFNNAVKADDESMEKLDETEVLFMVTGKN